jgi:hypothetical protein
MVEKIVMGIRAVGSVVIVVYLRLVVIGRKQKRV